MKIIDSVTQMRELRPQESLGFVATMGALHQGHSSLIEKSKQDNEFTCVSIFVNPTQFNDPRDFNSYPDQKKEDLDLCSQLGVDFVFMPESSEVYKNHETIGFVENELTAQYEGAHRKGHFSGVLLVVMKLLNIIRPQRAYFGEKDYQQYLLIKMMAEQFFMETEIIGVPTYRDEYGLALSSRNLNLSADGLKRAQQVASAFIKSSNQQEFIKSAGSEIDLEYYGEDWGRALMAHYIEGVRLIDNKKLNLEAKS